MGKEGDFTDLWDDSALINAFDEAITKYKKMHGKGFKENPNSCSTDVKSSCSVASASLAPAEEDDTSAPETCDGGNDDGACAILEVRESESLETAKGYEVADSEVPAEHTLDSSSMPLQDQPQNDPTSLDVDEYNKLYKQYYEVEEQRQQILQKMQSFSNWNYSYSSEAPVSGLQWGTSSVTQEYQSCTSQLPCGTMVVSCCPCASQCSMATCSSSPCPLSKVSGSLCADPLTTKDMGKQPADECVDIVKMALEAAERAISTLKNGPDSKQEDEMNNGGEQSVNCKTDLSTVLNAWFSAGLYTGKYLTERSIAKKQHD